MMSLKNLSLKENMAKSTVKPKFHKGFNDIVTKYGSSVKRFYENIEEIRPESPDDTAC
jgi:hypothetical protein